MATTYTYASTTVKSDHNNPWVLLSELTAELESSAWLRPPPDVVQHFYALVAQRRSPTERDALIAAGWKPFQYGLAEAIREVERQMLEHMHRISPGGQS